MTLNLTPANPPARTRGEGKSISYDDLKEWEAALNNQEQFPLGVTNGEEYKKQTAARHQALKVRKALNDAQLIHLKRIKTTVYPVKSRSRGDKADPDSPHMFSLKLRKSR